MTTPRRHAITLIPGDGVGPEVALATRRVLDAAAATAAVAFDWEEAEAGRDLWTHPPGADAEPIPELDFEHWIQGGYRLA